VSHRKDERTSVKGGYESGEEDLWKKGKRGAKVKLGGRKQGRVNYHYSEEDILFLGTALKERRNQKSSRKKLTVGGKGKGGNFPIPGAKTQESLVRKRVEPGNNF